MSDSPEASSPFVVFSDADNAAVATRHIEAGTRSPYADVRGEIPMGHKMATRPIRGGESVLLYGGETVGIAATDIAPGEHIHSHNLKSAIDLDSPYPPWEKPEFRDGAAPFPVRTTFAGFVRDRKSGRAVGTRNDVWIIPTCGCAATDCPGDGRFRQRVARRSHGRFRFGRPGPRLGARIRV